MNYYKKRSTSEPMKLDPTKVYYSNPNFNSQIIFPQIFVYTAIAEYKEDLANQYYIYNKDSGTYNACGHIDRLQKKYSYFIRELVPVIPYSISTIYEYKGYQAATSINPEKSLNYYTRQTIVDSDGQTQYNYTLAFSLRKDVKYFQKINGVEYEVSSTYSFTKGQSYYMKNSDGIIIGDPITIPKANLYIDEGFVQVAYANPVTENDICFFVDDNGFDQHIYFNGQQSNGCVMGKTNIIYKNANHELQDQQFEEGDYYILENNKFVLRTILKKYNIHKTYYELIEAYEPVEEFEENTDYYLCSVVFYENSAPRRRYYNFNDWYKFRECPNFVQLYIETKSGGRAGITTDDYGRTLIKYFTPVDRANAEYNENITYYIQSDADGKLYPLKKTLTKEFFYSSSFHFYISIVDQHIGVAKHCTYADLNTVYYNNADYDTTTFWNHNIDNPETLNFWFDFLDTEGEISKYSNQAIGNRPKAENDSNVKAIYYRETPDVIIVNDDVSDEDFQLQKEEKPGYTFIRMNSATENLFTISAQGKSAQDELDNLLYSNTYCTESISITCLPVYHLQPNTRIFIRDDKSGINGEYIITKITIPLAYNGMMNISAVKAVERIY